MYKNIALLMNIIQKRRHTYLYITLHNVNTEE